MDLGSRFEDDAQCGVTFPETKGGKQTTTVYAPLIESQATGILKQPAKILKK